jgi:hypothetical protein
MSGGVFISYRREDTLGSAGRIYDRLSRRLGRQNIFFDVDNIPPGADFFEVLTERVVACDVLIVIIGADWISSVDKDGQRRLEDPNDFVRVEIEAALQRRIRVIPVLVDGARMPKAAELPDSLKRLARRQSVEISHLRFDTDVKTLTRTLTKLQEEYRQRADVDREGRKSVPVAKQPEREWWEGVARPEREQARTSATDGPMRPLAEWWEGLAYKHPGEPPGANRPAQPVPEWWEGLANRNPNRRQTPPPKEGAPVAEAESEWWKRIEPPPPVAKTPGSEWWKRIADDDRKKPRSPAAKRRAAAAKHSPKLGSHARDRH